MDFQDGYAFGIPRFAVIIGNFSFIIPLMLRVGKHEKLSSIKERWTLAVSYLHATSVKELYVPEDMP